MTNHELLKLTANQVNHAGYTKAILAVGACEAHGPHLATGTDTLISYMLSCKIADQFRDIFYSMQDTDVAGWVRSLQLRGICLPDDIKDEVFLIIGERRIGQTG